MQFCACLRRIFGFSLSGQAIVNFGRALAGYGCRKCFDIRTAKVVSSQCSWSDAARKQSFLKESFLAVLQEQSRRAFPHFEW